MGDTPGQDRGGGPPSTPPPGWYADPWERADHRWWDGGQWTDQTRSAPTSPDLGWKRWALILGILGLPVVMVAVTSADDEPEPEGTATSTDDGAAASRDPCPRNGRSREVNAECIDPWPLTVSSGTLRCDADSVTIAARGNTWAVNGMATTRGDGDEIDPMWKDNPEIDGAKVNIGALVDAGLDLCG